MRTSKTAGALRRCSSMTLVFTVGCQISASASDWLPLNSIYSFISVWLDLQTENALNRLDPEDFLPFLLGRSTSLLHLLWSELLDFLLHWGNLFIVLVDRLEPLWDSQVLVLDGFEQAVDLRILGFHFPLKIQEFLTELLIFYLQAFVLWALTSLVQRELLFCYRPPLQFSICHITLV